MEDDERGAPIDDLIGEPRLGRVWALACRLIEPVAPDDVELVTSSMLESLLVAIAVEDAIMSSGNVLLYGGNTVFIQPGNRGDALTTGTMQREVVDAD